MLQVEAYQWLYLRRQQQEREWRWQAALHGAKLKEEYRASTNPQGVPALAQTFSGKMAVERIIVSKAELELRRGNCE